MPSTVTVCTKCASAVTLGKLIQYFRDELNYQKAIWIVVAKNTHLIASKRQSAYCVNSHAILVHMDECIHVRAAYWL